MARAKASQNGALSPPSSSSVIVPLQKDGIAQSSLADRIKQRSRRIQPSTPSSNPPAQPQAKPLSQLQAESSPQLVAKPPSQPQASRSSDLEADMSVTHAQLSEWFQKAVKRKAEEYTQSEFSKRLTPSTESEDTIRTAEPVKEDKPPFNETLDNYGYAEKVREVLKKQATSKTSTFGRRQAKLVHRILEVAQPTNDKEMLFLTGAEATQYMQPGVFTEYPILTQNQQPMPLQAIDDFLGEYYDNSTKVFVQDPSVRISSGEHFAREVSIGEVKKRFAPDDSPKSSKAPWNCLELATHVEDGLRPAFLNTEDCRLLTKVKIPSSRDKVGRRSYPQGYKEVEKWALLAQAGAITEPHQDSHGYSTYITVNQGRVGFGWLSNPSPEERAAWQSDPTTYTGGNWRYTVLQPGHTVYFPAGIIHFVFRLPSAGPSLAFGGHVLRCSTIGHWAETLLAEKGNQQIANEDITTSAPGYLNRVEAFVDQAYRIGTIEKWGGAEQVLKFKALKYSFDL